MPARLPWQARPVEQTRPPIDVLVNAVGPWATVRVDQPFEALQRRGWDVRLHPAPFDLNKVIRPHSLVIWQRPVPEHWDQWRACLQGMRRLGCLLLVEWDDHPELFPQEVRERMAICRHAHLQLAHALQCSSPRLAQALRGFHHLPLVVENGVEPLPPLNLLKHDPGQRLRVFLGNLNRVEEHRQLLPDLRRWLEEDQHMQLVTAGPSGLNGALPMERLDCHPMLSYRSYRQLLASCQVALLPLHCGAPQACKTPIKWMEAAVESTAVVAGPELYAPWVQEGRFGVWAEGPAAVVQEARRLAYDPERRRQLVHRAHIAAQDHALTAQLSWREALYCHLWRLRQRLDQVLVARWPELQ